MGMKMGILFLLVLGTCWAFADANRMLISDVSLMEASYEELKREAQPSKAEVENEVCTMCEQLTTTALDYIGQNETQTKIINALHMACYGVHSFKHQCITMVDYYVHLLFVKISTIQPQDICEKVNLCEELLIAPSQYQNICGFCHHVITQVMAKLKDPDTQMDIISSLLRGCDAVEKYAAQCKEVVIEYGPIVMINAEQFLEKSDLCATFHVCRASNSGTKQASPLAKASLLSES